MGVEDIELVEGGFEYLGRHKRKTVTGVIRPTGTLQGGRTWASFWIDMWELCSVGGLGFGLP